MDIFHAYFIAGLVCFIGSIFYEHFIQLKSITLTDLVLNFVLCLFLWPGLVFLVIIIFLKKFFDFCDTIVVLKSKDK